LARRAGFASAGAASDFATFARRRLPKEKILLKRAAKVFV